MAAYRKGGATPREESSTYFGWRLARNLSKLLATSNFIMFVAIVHDIDNSDFAHTCILLSIIFVKITLSRFSAICESVCFVSCPPFFG